ncbi:actin-like protein 7A [Molossus molossus]|uniref:Actin-like protein 7A n=1 Tax=Molossus molossus TaxID=27622 RepID=A0A7J8EBT5_MOLMO|nr:actin-like protein 7A [Molossus molossus]KAF6432806.1 actin like 7A [Molossus molossus]
MWAPQAGVFGDGPDKGRCAQASLNTQALQTASLKDGPAKRAVWVHRNCSVPEEPTKSAEVKEKPKVKLIKAVVVDLGTGYCKCGFAGQPKPTHKISSTVGKPYAETAQTGANRKETFVGQELVNPKVCLKLINPLRHGIIVDWDSVQDIWEYLFHQEMKIAPEDHAVLVSDPPLSPHTNREKYAEMLFETFNTPAMHIAYQSRLSMYSYGRTSGLVVEVGHGVSYVVPIYEGYPLPSITGRLDYAGSDLTDYLMCLLNNSGTHFTEDQIGIVEDIKKKCCFVALDPTEEKKVPDIEHMIQYMLPDGQVIHVGQERFLCSEMFFKPSLIKSMQLGLHTQTVSCLNKCDIALKRDLMRNILLCGGTTMLSGFPNRLQKELSSLCPNDTPQVNVLPERETAVWTGGSILASLQGFQSLWVHRFEYQEHGPFFLYRRCF